MDQSAAIFDAPTSPQCPLLPELPSDRFWDDKQWTVFWALMDTFVPAIVSKSLLADKQGQLGILDREYSTLLETAMSTTVERSDKRSLKAFLEDKPSIHPAVRGGLVRILSRLPTDRRDGLGKLLSGLSSSIGAFVLTGSCIPFQQQPLHVRQSIIQGWDSSWFSTLRIVSRSLARIAQISWLFSSPVFLEVSGYPDVPLNWEPGSDFDFKFLQFPPTSQAELDDLECDQNHSPPAPATTIETDVVIVGSGCGGSVAAKILAEAGHRVLVVDKGYYFPPSALPMPGPTAGRYLFDRHVAYSTDQSVSITAGSTWGGGGTVNWSVSLQTQDFVRKEWAAQGLSFFDGAEYQNCMDRVCERMGVGTEAVVQSHRGRVLLEGSRKLGWRADVSPLNSGGKEHSCGHCTMGCASGEKMGPTRCWLPDASAAGAEFIEGFEVTKVLFEGDAKKAIGVVGKWTSRDKKGSVSGPLEERIFSDVTIQAKKVIVACGAIWSPLLLMRSGLTNPHIGRNLHLHPAATLGGFYSEDTKPWEGGIITSYGSEFENLDGQGHGVKLELVNMTPFTFLPSMPWRSGLDFKRAALRYRHLAGFISVTRDRDAGRVYPDPATGAPRIEYAPSEFDRAHMLEGVLALCKIMYVTGARQIDPFIHGVKPFVRANIPNGDHDATNSIDSDPDFAAWLANVRQVGSGAGKMASSSAHQMGTCRMATKEEDGVVSPFGRVWGTESLYVADCSVFPNASGVNPMVTVMAIADWVAQAVDRDLRLK